MGQSKNDKAKSIVVAKDRETRMMMRSVVPAKRRAMSSQHAESELPSVNGSTTRSTFS